MLYVDALGMKARWASGSIDSITEAYDLFEERVRWAIDVTPLHGNIGGGIQSDAAALVFDESVDAVRVGMALFRTCFDQATQARRMWVRGLIVPTSVDAEGLIIDESLGGARRRLYRRRFATSLLQAVNVEQRFKGPRLLLAAMLKSQELQDALAVPVGGLHFVPIRDLGFTPPPDRLVAGEWCDVLYLAPAEIDEASIRQVRLRMGERMKWAACSRGVAPAPSPGRAPDNPIQFGSSEEMDHVGMLAVVWEETEAILRGKLVAATRGGRKRPR